MPLVHFNGRVRCTAIPTGVSRLCTSSASVLLCDVFPVNVVKVNVSRRKCVFQRNPKQRISVPNIRQYPSCYVCELLLTFTASHEEHSDISDHLQTEKLKADFQAASSSTKLASFCKESSCG
jgi:hypothetical protein